MNLEEVVKKIKERLPVELVADRDNVGLIVGDYDDECGTMIVAYELDSGVIEEARDTGSNLVVTYHTPLFRPMNSFTSSKSRPEPLFHAARSRLNVFAVHTGLDVTGDGLNFDLASRLGLSGVTTLSPLSNTLYKVVVFVPADHLEKVRAAMARSGAGRIGNYTECSFSAEGEGSFVPGEGSSPYVGSTGKIEKTTESRLEMVVDKPLTGRVIEAMVKAHPYEEVAYDIYPLVNESVNYGFGAIGTLEEPLPVRRFLERVKKLLALPSLRVSHLPDSSVRKVALCAGSGVSFYRDAVRKGADIFITGDVKHHDFREARLGHTILADATHRGTEKFAAELLHGILKQTFENRVVVNLSKHDYDSAVIF
jgi:dinuclear metal center YbgI/SA1388 family protein